MIHKWFTNGMLVLVIISFPLGIIKTVRTGLFATFPKVQATLNTYTLFLPLIKLSVSEYDTPDCRWQPIYGSSEVSIFYDWGSNLQSSQNPWRIAFEAGLSDWNIAPTKVTFYYHSYEDVLINTYSLNDGFSGYAVPFCDGTITTYYKVFGNTYYTQSTNSRHAIAGHEVGHGQSIGHIGNAEIALMGFNPDNNTYFVPLPIDILLVNQIYP